MTRFNILLEEGVEMVLFAIEKALGGEIFVPKIPSYKILDVAKAIAPKCKIKETGIRPGEKLHEEMITESDSFYTIEFDRYYAILPADADMQKYINYYKAKKIPRGFKYSSSTNNEWLSIEQIRELLKKNIDPNFEV